VARVRSAAPSRTRAAGDHLVWLLLALTLAVWLVETGGALWRTSHWDQYVYLADAFLHGQLHCFHHPADAGDMAIVGGRAYVVFGPLPAIPLLPLVFLFGPRTPDVLVLVLTALFGLFCFDRLLAALPDPPDRIRRAMTTLTFALGTAIHYGAPMANVWLEAQITATALQCWALWKAARGRAWWSGIALGLTVLTRSTVTLAAPAALWMLARGAGAGHPRVSAGPAPESAASRTRWIRAGVALGVPVVIAAALHGLYNFARFGSPTNAGYHDILMGGAFESLVTRYGRFNVHFLAHNLGGWLFALPHLAAGRLAPDGHGMSLLLTTPFLLLLLWPRRVSALEWILLGNSLLIALPSLLYYNDGWVQFGQRFALDWIALGLAACALASRRAPGWLVASLAIIGIGVNVWGTLWFQANNLH
jgi:hypothetical protein